MRRSLLSLGGSHPLEQPGVAAADFQLFRVAPHADDLAATVVTRDAVDFAYVHQRAAVNLPELVRVELFHQLLDRLADQRLGAGGLHPRVLFVADKEQHFVHRDHLDGGPHAGLDARQAWRRGAGVHPGGELVQQVLELVEQLCRL